MARVSPSLLSLLMEPYPGVHPVPSPTQPMFLGGLCAHPTLTVALIDLVSISFANKFFKTWNVLLLNQGGTRRDLMGVFTLSSGKLPQHNPVFFWTCDIWKSDSSVRLRMKLVLEEGKAKRISVKWSWCS